MALLQFPAVADPVVVAEHLRRHGYAIVRDAADPDVLDRFDAEVRPFVEASAYGRDVYDGRHTRRTGALIARCPAARELSMHPIGLGVAKAFLSHSLWEKVAKWAQADPDREGNYRLKQRGGRWILRHSEGDELIGEAEIPAESDLDLSALAAVRSEWPRLS